MRSNKGERSVNPQEFRQQALEFIASCRAAETGYYVICPSGQITLGASCYAAMTMHYLGALHEISAEEKANWAQAIRKFQNPQTGLFEGPEIQDARNSLSSDAFEYASLHLTSLVLPALDVLESRPDLSIAWAKQFLGKERLREWLSQRDWRRAWHEGNNLLFLGQFLIHLRDQEKIAKAQTALDAYFEWLDLQMDPQTGLWGTNGFCDAYEAVYGAYHQLLVYYYCERPLPYAARTIDTVLRLQHPDGTFTRRGGGGACEDVDAVDMIVNCYRRTGHRPRAVRFALADCLDAILQNRMPDGGFVYVRNQPLIQSGLQRTYCPPNTSNLFATWFRVHTIALICGIVRDHPLASIPWQFNRVCSMGWHNPELVRANSFGRPLDLLPRSGHQMLRRLRVKIGDAKTHSFLRHFFAPKRS